MNMNRKEKIDLLKAIHRGSKSIQELSKVSDMRIWEDLRGKPGHFIEVISGRVCSLAQLKQEYANDTGSGVSIFWCNVDLSKVITEK